ASADQPAPGAVVAIGEIGQGSAAQRHACRQVGDAQAVVAHPAAADLAVEQQLIDGIAEAGSHGRDPAIVVVDQNGPNARNDDPCAVMIAGPVEAPSAANDEVANLVIAADLTAADEYATAIVEVRQEDGVRPIIVRPGAAKIDADVEAGPIQDGHRRW